MPPDIKHTAPPINYPCCKMLNLNLNKHLGVNAMFSKYKGKKEKLNNTTRKKTDKSRLWDVLQIN